MRQQKNQTTIREASVIGICAFLLASGGGALAAVSTVLAEEVPVLDTPADQDNQSNAPRDKNPQPIFPPTNDPEMVVKPEVPLDPDAVVVPPVLDPEMAVNPATGEHLTEEKLERLTPEKLEKDMPDQQGIPEK